MTRIEILYGVVVKSSNGGVNMDSFLVEKSAVARGQEIVKAIKDSKRKGFKVYISELEYDEYKNRILSDSLINSDSRLLFEN
ncbi:hypothetical protein [Bacillus atrophaeus]|uniref:hypothetical protein n=1 Tax=Bacillus atrophaeus TaxID=1452 RepID=UPI000D03DE0B|nr:hypothetical protein [Bacillus atrophaeus]MCY9166553.1 hypothetical protein [Bacillus atrophaeus]PRR87420.1 hypothetical protein C6W23_18950 [Bacillus atrophaeus]